MIDFVRLAYSIAKEAHKGQVDKAGVDYIEHPKKVASYVQTNEEKVVAYLHDIIEDTDVTLDDLRNYGFSEKIIVAVDVLTRKKGQAYQSYLEIVKSNELAKNVKLADLRHNSDLSRLSQIKNKDLERNLKYQAAIKFLSTSK